jgi:hypothetical protein
MTDPTSPLSTSGPSAKAFIATRNTPRRLSFDGRTTEVTEVLDAWLAPDHRYFKVRGDDGACYILRNDALTGRWEAHHV